MFCIEQKIDKKIEKSYMLVLYVQEMDFLQHVPATSREMLLNSVHGVMLCFTAVHMIIKYRIIASLFGCQ